MKNITKLIYFHKKHILLFTVFLMTVSLPMVTYAISPEWQVVYNKLKPWVNRAGMLFIVLGAVDFGTGFYTDDAAPRGKGIAKMIGGACLLAVYSQAMSLFNL